MKKRDVNVIKKITANTISKISDIKIGDTVELLSIYDEDDECGEIDDSPYGLIVDIGYDSFVIRWYLKAEQKEDNREFSVVDESDLENCYSIIFADKKVIMAWLI